MQNKNNYSDPQLRERLKNKILKSNKGSRSNTWSARKSQMLALQYKKSGGSYRGTKSSKQKALTKWNSEKWQTFDGKPAIRKNAKGETITKRFLPKAAWSKLSKSQIAATNSKKVLGSKNNKQFVKNTKLAEKAGRAIRQNGYT